ncbi:hypothetical protein JVU11DRAFT_7644 [Chiua virens]|nr:hypothetical protein JVU11DRAFT_7644 [Chiua virens]
MAHLSPGVTLVWALLSITLQTFLLYHLWSFDRFKCLKWNHGPHSGAFKRIMTYSYLLSVPLLVIYSVGFAAIKYTYGYSVIPTLGITPTPYQLWSKTAQNAIFPLYLSFSVAWGLEMVTHLEELCFWLFFVNAGMASHQDWFRTRYFKIWAVGSCIAILAMPLITIFTRENVYKCEAYTFLIGGLGSLALTIWFLPVLWAFPSFIGNLKQHEIEMNTLVRLTRFHEMNCIRVVFRFLFTIPMVILGIDGVRPHQHINDKMFPTDLLAIIAGIGCVVSSGITLVIFFPRWIEGEITAKERQGAARVQPQRESLPRWNATPPESDVQSYISITQSKSEDLLDNYDIQIGAPQFPYTNSNTNTGSLNGSLPAYEVAVTRAPVERVPSKKVALEDHHHLAAHSLTPNRLMIGGEGRVGCGVDGQRDQVGEGAIEAEREREQFGATLAVADRDWTTAAADLRWT